MSVVSTLHYVHAVEIALIVIFFFNLCIFFNFFRFWSQRIKLTLQSSLAVVFRRTVPATKLSFPSSSSSKNTTKS